MGKENGKQKRKHRAGRRKGKGEEKYGESAADRFPR